MNEGTEKIKSLISDEKIKIVSFDVFDTLILRPFLKPTDLFVIMNNDFKKLMPDSSESFTVIRMASEKSARINSENGEITLDEIYDEMTESFQVSKEIADKMKKLEITLEINGCYARKTGLMLFNHAVQSGKKIILATDMYLPENIIAQILEKSGYKGYEKIFLSCVLNKNKCTGSMYHHILETYNIDADEMLHIGDNYVSDVEKPRNIGIKCCYMPSPAELIKSTIASASDENQYFTARTYITRVANNYFDDPFKSGFNEDVLLKHQTDDGLAEKINAILPVGSKKRKIAGNIAHKIFGK